jgi:uncharacterized protein with HEPN domain
MPKRLVRPALATILEAIHGIETTIADKTLEQYAADWASKHAVERGIEIISEASKRIPQDLRDSRPEVDWRAVAGIGNVLRHEYDAIIDEVIYDAARTRLAQLRDAIIAIEAGLDEPLE